MPTLRFSFLLQLILGLTLLGVVACTAPRGVGDDDDSATGDDDDDVSDDDDATDDDDVLGDDDDATDDDDAATDDDDAAPVELPYSVMAFQLELNVVQASGTNYGLGGTYKFIYYESYDQANQVEYCREVIEFEAVAQFGPNVVAGCNNCTGQISLDETLVDHVSNPAIDPAHCDPSWLNADDDGNGFPDYSFGWRFVTSQANGGDGDFLNLGLIDYSTFASLGLFADLPSVDQFGVTTPPQNDASALAAPWQGMDVTHFGYVNAQPGTFSETSGLSTVAGTAGAGSNYRFYFTIAKNPAVNSHNGTDMVGEYVGGAAWIINFDN